MVDAESDLLLRSRKSWTRDNSDGITHSIEALAIFRGIYKRVAVQLDVDPSYVSRVARGERHAPFVTEALRKEIQRVLGKAGLHDGDGHNHNHDHNNNHGHNNNPAITITRSAITITTATSTQSLVAHTRTALPFARWSSRSYTQKEKQNPRAQPGEAQAPILKPGDTVFWYDKYRMK